MFVNLSEELCKAAGNLKEWGVDDEKVRWSGASINLGRYSNSKVRKLREHLTQFKTVKGARSALRDLDTWIEASEEGLEKVRCRNTKQFSSLVYEFMQKQPRFHLYRKDEDRDIWRAYYVGNIEFHERKEATRHQSAQPAFTRIRVYYRELGEIQSTCFSFEDEDVRGKTPRAVLADAGLLVQTDELRAEYEANLGNYAAWHDKIGMQFLARGVGTNDLDGNSKWSRGTLVMEKGGEPSRVVIDIIHEGDDKRRESEERYAPNFWGQKSLLEANDDEDLDVVDPDDDEVDPDAPKIEIEIPVFPVVPTFDLRRHTRLRIHVANLEPYDYEDKLGEKLVLPTETRDLVTLLVSDKGEFRDIVKNKGGGAVILCAGPPGCGKTLTAEVYAEVMHRPLYSVQCSQLGTDEEALEKALLLVFSRAQRWDAILLLDEADVYVAARGSNIQQNAIVGVFLRVLEYYSGVLFMTTNRSDSVDDAITSRCLARIDYQVPTPEDQARIWHVLAEGAGIPLAKGMIEKVISTYPTLSGRDVKQLLKLASKVVRSRGEEEITFEVVQFVKRFKPTPDDEKAGTNGGTGGTTFVKCLKLVTDAARRVVVKGSPHSDTSMRDLRSRVTLMDAVPHSPVLGENCPCRKCFDGVTQA